MTCAKVRVLCTIEAINGVVTGENRCRNPQAVCPRAPGEDYKKCSTICDQVGHAEIDAINQAREQGLQLNGAVATLYGHTYYCRPCQEALFDKGVRLERGQ